MTSLIASTGNDLSTRRGPYVLAVGSHKGGTGRTTTALALAWCWGQSGRRVTLIDAEPVQAASLVAAGADGVCPWANVRLVGQAGSRDRAPLTGDLAVIDCPSLTDPASLEVLAHADGLLLTTQAELLALRTMPTATRAVLAAQAINPRLEFVGLLLPAYDEGDELQGHMLAELRRAHGHLLIEPPIPRRPELRDWPMSPGSPLPSGPARTAYQAVADALAARLTVPV